MHQYNHNSDYNKYVHNEKRDYVRSIMYQYNHNSDYTKYFHKIKETMRSNMC